MALFTVVSVPFAAWLAVLLRLSSASEAISAIATAKLISCQMRTGLGMDASLSNVVTGELEKLLGGHWFQVLFAVLHGFQSSAI